MSKRRRGENDEAEPTSTVAELASASEEPSCTIEEQAYATCEPVYDITAEWKVLAPSDWFERRPRILDVGKFSIDGLSRLDLSKYRLMDVVNTLAALRDGVPKGPERLQGMGGIGPNFTGPHPLAYTAGAKRNVEKGIYYEFRVSRANRRITAGSHMETPRYNRCMMYVSWTLNSDGTWNDRVCGTFGSGQTNDPTLGQAISLVMIKDALNIIVKENTNGNFANADKGIES